MTRTRLLIPLALVFGTLALPAAANASFQAQILSDRDINLTGTDDAEALVISSSGSFFAHDQTSPGFDSPFDFDSRTPGTQPVTDSPRREVFIVDGEGGDDKIRLDAGGGSLRADGDEGDDTIIGGPRDNLIQGASGDDLIFGGASRDIVFLGSGDDAFRWGPMSSRNKDEVDGGDGDDTVEMTGSAASEFFRVQGFASGVLVDVTAVSDAASLDAIERLDLDLLDGDDVLIGASGPDQLIGGDGRDDVRGSSGDDLLSGESVLGGAGNDRTTVETSNEPFPTIVGEDGYDVTRVVTGAGTETAIAVDGGAGDDLLRGSDGLEWLFGASGEDVVDGGLAPDRLFGGVDADVIRARDGAAPGAASALARVTASDELRLGSGIVRVPVTCSAGARGGCQGALSLVSADPIVVGGVGAPMLLGRQTVALAPGTTAKVDVPVPDRDDLARAAGLRFAVKAQVLTATAEHTTPQVLQLLK